jgi:succinate dehydrogenase / fumarate reductase iron-sulfur subunit
VTPLRAFPVVRDLVTDVSFNYQKAREIPAFAPPKGVQPGEYRMAQEDVARSQEFRKCIECFLCQDTCHVVRDHEENKAAFAGPRFLMRVAELDMHPLDSADRVTPRRTSTASGTATSRSAAPRSAPSTSRSRTTP